MNASAMKQVLECIKLSRGKKCLVLLSAVSGVTDSLLEAAGLSVSDLSQSLNIIEKLRLLHLSILNDLTDSVPVKEIGTINDIFAELTDKLTAFNTLGELTTQNIDSVQSCGELLSTTIFSSFLEHLKIKSVWIDIRKIIKTDSNFTNAEVNFEMSAAALSNHSDIFKTERIIISQGFIASDNKDRTTTIGRGGSDYSAALMGKLLKHNGIDVDEIQIWTDVDGVLSADPRIVINAVTIKTMTPSEIRTLSYLGAKVLHPDTIKPAVSSNIAVRVLNTFNPESQGTLISNDLVYSTHCVHSLIRIDDCYELSLRPEPEISSWEFMQKILNIADNGKCNAVYSSAEDNSAVLYFRKNPHLFLGSKFAENINVRNCSLIALVGCDLKPLLPQIYEISSELGLVISGMSDSVVYLKSSNNISNEMLIKIHNKIIK